jgi:PadR family transcriptional regulator PadR
MPEPDFLAGTLRVLILSELSCGASYGYAIAKSIDESTGGQLTVRPESLYPVLHRMESDGLLEAKWEQADGGRPRKVYRITPRGRKRWDKVREKFLRVMSSAVKAVEGNVGAKPASPKGGAYEPAK